MTGCDNAQARPWVAVMIVSFFLFLRRVDAARAATPSVGNSDRLRQRNMMSRNRNLRHGSSEMLWVGPVLTRCNNCFEYFSRRASGAAENS